MTHMQLKIVPLSPTIGAEIGPIDLAQPLDDEMHAELHRALLQHKVLFFRDQDITQEQHIAFARRFGDLEVHPFAPRHEHPELLVIAHDENNRGKENTWHSDVTWRLKPSLGSILRAIDVPPIGGDTLFADMHAAYEALGDSMKQALSGLTAIHDFSRVFGRGLPPEKLGALKREYPPAQHPVVRTHPETGEKSLYVNRAFTSHIVGMAPDESEKLLEFLYSRASIPEYQCRFRWRRNSIAFWDNRAVQHYAVSDYFPHRREMHRVTVVGDAPV
jgi:taurine dioxygenase